MSGESWHEDLLSGNHQMRLSISIGKADAVSQLMDKPIKNYKRANFTGEH